MVVKMKPDYIFKVVLGGAGGVGKTTLLLRFIYDVFNADTQLTIGVGFLPKKLEYKAKNIVLSLWDLGGQERFRIVQSSFIRGAIAGIVFFDMSRPKTIDQVQEWVEMFRNNANAKIPIFLSGTKLDCVNQGDLDIIQKEANTVVERFGLTGFFPTSSKTGTNVEEIMHAIIDVLI
jgi:small GTP-binding protein